MKMKKVLAMAASTLLCSVMLAGCGSSESSKTDSSSDSGSSSSSSSEKKDSGSSSGSLIKVGIINNDPNESGYRTANVNDLKATFTKENGFDASCPISASPRGRRARG